VYGPGVPGGNNGGGISAAKPTASFQTMPRPLLVHDCAGNRHAHYPARAGEEINMKQTIVKITKCREWPHCASSKWYCCLIKRGLPDGDGLPDWWPLEDADKPAPSAPPSTVPAEAAGETPLLDAATELLEVSDLRGDSEMPNPCDDPKLWTSRAQEAWENLRIAVDEKEAEKPAPRPGKPPSLPRGPEICNDFIET